MKIHTWKSEERMKIVWLWKFEKDIMTMVNPRQEALNKKMKNLTLNPRRFEYYELSITKQIEMHEET